MTPEILIVGEPAERRELADLVAANGYAVSLCPPRQLNRRVRTSNPPAVIIACMEDIEPDVLLAGLRRTRAGASIPVVVYGRLGGDLRDLADVLDIGADHFLEEPADERELADALNQYAGPPEREPTRDLGRPRDRRPTRPPRPTRSEADERGTGTGRISPPREGTDPKAGSRDRQPQPAQPPQPLLEEGSGDGLGNLHRTLDRLDARLRDEPGLESENDLEDLGLDAIPDVDPVDDPDPLVTEIGEHLRSHAPRPREERPKPFSRGRPPSRGRDSRRDRPDRTDRFDDDRPGERSERRSRDRYGYGHGGERDEGTGRFPRFARGEGSDRFERSTGDPSTRDASRQPTPSGEPLRTRSWKRPSHEGPLRREAHDHELPPSTGGRSALRPRRPRESSDPRTRDEPWPSESGEIERTAPLRPERPSSPDSEDKARDYQWGGQRETGRGRPRRPARSELDPSERSARVPERVPEPAARSELPFEDTHEPSPSSSAFDDADLDFDAGGPDGGAPERDPEPRRDPDEDERPARAPSTRLRERSSSETSSSSRLTLPREPAPRSERPSARPPARRRDAPPPSAVPRIDPSVRETGKLGEGVEVPPLLWQLHEQRFTGKLRLSRQRVEKQVWLRDGEPSFVRSNANSDRLVDGLLRRGVLTRPQYETARRLAAKEPRRVGQLLVDSGFLKARELDVLLRDHLARMLDSTFVWTDGAWATEPGERSDEPIQLDVPLPSLLLDGLRYRLDASELEARISRRAGRGALVPKLLAKLDDDGLAELGERYGLLPEEASWLQRFDGRHGAAALIAEGADEQALFAFVHALDITGLIVLREQPELSVDDGRDPSGVDGERIRERLRLAREADYFELLGLARDAARSEIRQAHTELAATFSDRALESDSRRRHARELRELRAALDEARDILADDAMRSAYLAHLGDSPDT